jgi:hypothetical protein
MQLLGKLNKFKVHIRLSEDEIKNMIHIFDLIYIKYMFVLFYSICIYSYKFKS